MGRHLANCGRTVDLGSGGITATTPCDCACEGCCCQYFQYSSTGTDLIVTFDWDSYDFPYHDPPPLLACLGIGTVGSSTVQIVVVNVFFDFCPPYPDDLVVSPDYIFNFATAEPPITIPDAALADCITLVFYDNNGNEATRCTVKFNAP